MLEILASTIQKPPHKDQDKFFGTHIFLNLLLLEVVSFGTQVVL
jgi:hypothetical protein